MECTSFRVALAVGGHLDGDLQDVQSVQECRKTRSLLITCFPSGPEIFTGMQDVYLRGDWIGLNWIGCTEVKLA